MLLDKCVILDIVKEDLFHIQLRSQFCSNCITQFSLQIPNLYIENDMADPSIRIEQLSYEALDDFKSLRNGFDYLAGAKEL